MQDLNWVDYTILAIFMFSIIAGIGRGLVKEIMSLLAIIVAFTVAIIFAHPLALAFTNSESVQTTVNQASAAIGMNAAQPVSYAAIGLSFGFLFAATALVASIIGSVINLAFQAGILGIGNRLLGGVFGICRGFIINLVIIFLVQLTSFSTDSFWTQSRMVASFQPAVLWLGQVVSPALADLKSKMGEKLNQVNETIQSTTEPTSE